MAAAVESQIGLPSPGTEESCVLVFFFNLSTWETLVILTGPDY